jgi:hypothetical protein
MQCSICSLKDNEMEQKDGKRIGMDVKSEEFHRLY